MAKRRTAKQITITKAYVKQLVEKYMAMDKENLIAEASKPGLSVLEYSICNILVKCIPLGDFSKLDEFIDETISRLEAIEPAVPQQTALEVVTDANDLDLDAMDFDLLREQLAKSVFASTRLMATQAVHEFQHVGKLRNTIATIEDRLFSPDTLKRLPDTVLAKVYASASGNLNNSINYIRSVNSNLTQQLDVINQIQNMKKEGKEAPVKDTSNPNVQRIREMIAKKIQEKSAMLNEDE